MKNEKLSEEYFKISRKNRQHVHIRNKIAFECEVSTTVAYNWLNGSTPVPAKYHKIIATVFEMPVKELFPEVEYEQL